MRLGFFGANVGAMASSGCGRVARHAEELGYSSLWTGEHVVLPRPRQEKPALEPDWPMTDSLITLACIAAQTERIELCTGVLILPQHNPVQLAKQLATLDVLSGGRLVVGLGTGYVAAEFAAIGVPMKGRRERSREYLSAMRALWGEDPEFDCRYVSFRGVDAYPKPLRPEGPRVVFGGVAASALTDATALGDGWYGFGQTPEQVAVIVSDLRRTLADAGSDRPFRICVTPRARLSPSLVDDYREAGVGELVVSVESDTLDGVRRRLDYNAPERLGIETIRAGSTHR